MMTLWIIPIPKRQQSSRKNREERTKKKEQRTEKEVAGTGEYPDAATSFLLLIEF